MAGSETDATRGEKDRHGDTLVVDMRGSEDPARKTLAFNPADAWSHLSTSLALFHVRASIDCLGNNVILWRFVLRDPCSSSVCICSVYEEWSTDEPLLSVLRLQVPAWRTVVLSLPLRYPSLPDF